MVKFEPDPRGLKELLKSKQVAAMLERAAPPLAARIRAATPVSHRPGGGGTAASTTVDRADMSLVGDRVRVRISQRSYSGRNRPAGGAAAPLQFGNAITEQRSQFARGLGGGAS